MNQFGDILTCVQFAAQKHKDHLRSDTNETSYIIHAVNVATILAVEGHIDNKEILQAALLHDTLEDTETTFDEIEAVFGKDVTDIVRVISDTDDKSFPEEEQETIKMAHTRDNDQKANLVKLAKELDNLRDHPVGWTEERLEEYFLSIKGIVDNLRGTNEHLESQFDTIFRQKNLL